MMPQAQTSDPLDALMAQHGAIPPEAPPPVEAHPEARIGPPRADAPVTLGDIEDNPTEAFKRLGGLLKRDLKDPRNWVAAAAAYFGPRIISSVAPIAVNALRAAPEATMRGIAKVGDVVSPDVVGIVSPRAGRALEVAQRMRAAMQPPTASAPVETAGAGAPTSSVAAPPAPAPPAPPARDMALPPSPRQAPTAPPKPIPAALKLKLTAEEYQAAKGLVQQGYEPSEVLSAIQRQRLPEAWKKLPSDAQVRAKVTDRNAKGQWPED